MYMKKIAFVLSLLALIALGFSIPVLAKPPSLNTLIGWKIVFSLDDQRVEVGASNRNCVLAGYDLTVLSDPGIHLGIGSGGYIQYEIYRGALAPVAETIVIWNSAKTDRKVTLSWQWQNRYIHGDYQNGFKPPYMNVHLSLNSGIPYETVTQINPNSGSEEINVVSGVAPGFGYRITLAVIPALKKVVSKNK